MKGFPVHLGLLVISCVVFSANAFVPCGTTSYIKTNSISSICSRKSPLYRQRETSLFNSLQNEEVTQVVELTDDDGDVVDGSQNEEQQSAVSAPFLSQGEILEESLQFSNDPQQTRVIIYIIISLIPVLFLIPLMLGSRDLIPLDALPPVDV